MKIFLICYLLFEVCLASFTPSNIDCGIENFPCDTNNQCVKRNEWCDKKPDCGDSSDEAYCKTAGWFNSDPNSCKNKHETHILCDSGICVPIAAQCDGKEDCEDGFDEKFCPNETTLFESSETFTKEDDSSSEVKTTPSAGSSLIPRTTQYYKEDKIPTTSTTPEAYSNRINGFPSTSTSYYEKRMKEADTEINYKKSPITFPETFPTLVYVGTNSAISPTAKTYSTSFSTTTAATTPRNTVIKRPPVSTLRPQNTHIPRYNSQQPRNNNRQVNNYRPSINHYQLHTNYNQLPPDYYRTPSNRYPPYTNSNQAPASHYPPHTNHNQASASHYPPHTNHYRPHQPPSYTNNYHQHRPLNGEPDHQYQINYFKPYNTQPGVRKAFYFAKDYAALYGRHNDLSIHEGMQWLLRQRSESDGDWGGDTSRAVVALALVNDSFFNGNSDGEIIKRRFMIQLGADLLRNNTKNFNINKMSKAINGLMAICEDPTDFHGVDLAEILRSKVENNKNRSYLSPFVSLSLCLSNKSLSSSEIQSLMKQMAPSGYMNEISKDMQSAAIMAFSCHVHTSEDPAYRTSLQTTLRNAVANLLNRMAEDGSFGSVYSTALAAQALMSTNESRNWNVAKTLNVLKQQQREDGSFGDLLASYFVLPALSGRSLLHLRNINCNPVKKAELSVQEIIDFAGPKQYVHYSLYFGYPLVNSLSLYLLVPREANLLDVMRVAEHQDENFRFALENNNSKVYSLSGLPNDPEMGLSWHLYVKHESSPYAHEPNARERITGDVRSLSPKSGDHLIFWYHSNELRI